MSRSVQVGWAAPGWVAGGRCGAGGAGDIDEGEARAAGSQVCVSHLGELCSAPQQQPELLSDHTRAAVWF